MTVTQAAAALGVSRSNIFRLLNEGRLSATKDSRGVFDIPDHEVKAHKPKPMGHQPKGATKCQHQNSDQQLNNYSTHSPKRTRQPKGV